jgi:catechol 2,3-dioxygenase-like lactoylglutathione lyase family enzyme
MEMSTSKQSSIFATEMRLKLTHSILRVKNPSELIQFYVNKFGMRNIEMSTASLAYNVHILGYTTNYDENFNVASSTLPSPTFLEFHYDDSSTTNQSLINSGPSNVYWKIGITLHDVDFAREILQSKQVNIDNPSQFEDIGYVCHLRDPNGFVIELLQHDFQETFKAKMNESGRKSLEDHFPLGYPSCIGQITLQANDMDKTQWFYQDLLCMKLLSIQEVPKFGFTLYFFAWTNENPPKSDIKDVSTNREWLWKRPYTTIEIRHFHNQRQIAPFRDLKQNEIGFEGIRIMCNDLNMFIVKMKAEKISFQESNGTYGKEIIIRDPDNVPIHVSQNKNEE